MTARGEPLPDRIDPAVERSGTRLALVVLAAVVLAELSAILVLNHGVFTFTLDDPYIHLALSENIIRGHYGVNAVEASAPSSSIIWAFLLAPGAWSITGGIYLALLLNVAAAAALVVVYGKMLGRVLVRLRSAPVFALCVVLLAGATNVLGLVFVGMEHTLQVLLVALVVFGLVREVETGQPPPFLLAAIVLAPLVRYECLAVSGAALGYLLLRGHVRAVLLTAGLLVAGLVAFSAFLLSHGLEPLPTSVVAKSQVAAGRIGGVLSTLRDALKDFRGVLLAVAALLLGTAALDPRRVAAERLLALAIAGAIGLHLLVGRYGAYHRYEVYIWATATLSLLYVGRVSLSGVLDRLGPWRFALAATIWAALLHAHFVQNLITIPIAANNIYEQQYQMHRFAVAYGRPVAVNDLGYVSYGNPQYVLDLGGLASLEALRHRRGTDTAWLERLTTQHDVRLAMVYDDWVTRMPATWRRVGRLELGKVRVTPAGSVVSFYVIGDDGGEVARRLAAFTPTLPPGVTLTLD